MPSKSDIKNYFLSVIFSFFFTFFTVKLYSPNLQKRSSDHLIYFRSKRNIFYYYFWTLFICFVKVTYEK